MALGSVDQQGTGKTLLLLGGSKQQVVAIETAKRLGYRTVLCDYLPDNPGQYSADVFYQTSTTDREAVLDVARKERVNGVLAYASDPAAPTAAYVAEKLGLPGNPLKSVEILSEKHLFRRHLRAAGLPCPRAASFNADATSEQVLTLVEGFRWPIVVKPTDSSGSKGVSVVRHETDLSAALDAARMRSRNGVLIAEEFIERGFPRVVGGDIFVVDGVVKFWGLMSCLRDERMGGLVPTGKILPAGLTDAQTNRVKEVLQDLVSSLDIACGEMNVEVLLGADDTPYVLELGARAGGNMIPVQLSDASGIDLVEANVRCAMGEDLQGVEFDGGGKCCAHVVIHSEHDGIFESVDYGPLRPHLYREVLYHSPGERIHRFADAGDAVGIAFLSFADESEMDEALLSDGGQIKVIVR